MSKERLKKGKYRLAICGNCHRLAVQKDISDACENECINLGQLETMYQNILTERNIPFNSTLSLPIFPFHKLTMFNRFHYQSHDYTH